jgi:hypothetical protein
MGSSWTSDDASIKTRYKYSRDRKNTLEFPEFPVVVGNTDNNSLVNQCKTIFPCTLNLFQLQPQNLSFYKKLLRCGTVRNEGDRRNWVISWVKKGVSNQMGGCYGTESFRGNSMGLEDRRCFELVRTRSCQDTSNEPCSQQCRQIKQVNLILFKNEVQLLNTRARSIDFRFNALQYYSIPPNDE